MSSRILLTTGIFVGISVFAYIWTIASSAKQVAERTERAFSEYVFREAVDACQLAGTVDSNRFVYMAAKVKSARLIDSPIDHWPYKRTMYQLYADGRLCDFNLTTKEAEAYAAPFE